MVRGGPTVCSNPARGHEVETTLERKWPTQKQLYSNDTFSNTRAQNACLEKRDECIFYNYL